MISSFKFHFIQLSLAYTLHLWIKGLACFALQWVLHLFFSFSNMPDAVIYTSLRFFLNSDYFSACTAGSAFRDFSDAMSEEIHFQKH